MEGVWYYVNQISLQQYVEEICDFATNGHEPCPLPLLKLAQV